MGNFQGGGGGISLSQIPENIAAADLSDVSAKTGTGTELLGATTASLAADDYFKWDGAKVVNAVPALAFRVDDDGTGSIVTGDKFKIVTFGNATANAVSIAQAGTAGFEAGWYAPRVCTTGAGATTITPTTSTINGAATLVLTQNQCAAIHSDGTNYRAAIMSSGGGLGYETQLQEFVAFSPSDSTTYYFGCRPLISPTTALAESNHRCLVPKAGTIKRWDFYVVGNGVQGTTETFTCDVFLNNTTSVGALVTCQISAANGVLQTYSSTGISQAVVAGDGIVFRIQTPVWTTNPTSVTMMAKVYIE